MKKVKVYNRNKKHESNHEFDITHTVLKNKNVVYALSYAENNTWSMEFQGRNIITVTDDGDAMIFKFNELFDFKNLGYDETYYIFVILKYIGKQSDQKFNKYKFVESK